MPVTPATQMQIHEFGKLPVAYNGRIKPMDTLARNALRVLSEKTSLEDHSAIYWLLDLVTESPSSLEHRILRIENLDVLQSLGLEPREGFATASKSWKRITVNTPSSGVWRVKFLAISRTDAEKFLALEILAITLLQAFSSPAIRTGSFEQIQADFEKVDRQIAILNQSAPGPCRR